jgi:hypothetical protein
MLKPLPRLAVDGSGALDSSLSRPGIWPTMPLADVMKLDTCAGELWRIAVVLSRLPETAGSVWDDFCISDVDTMMYAGRPLNELVFWDKGEDGRYQTVELPAFRISLARDERRECEFLRGALLTQGRGR